MDFPSAERDGALALSHALRARCEQIAQRWADLTLFRAVYTSRRDDALGAARQIVDALADVAEHNSVDDMDAAEWARVRQVLGRIAATRIRAGVGPSGLAAEAAEVRGPLSAVLGEQFDGSAEAHEAAVLAAVLVGTLRVVLLERVLTAGSDTIARQRVELREIATPVIRLWDSVLAVPLIGTLDSARAQTALETLLDQIVEQDAAVAILDITGVPMVDAMVAQHLMKTVLAVRLMGAECVVSGIRPQIAQTMVQLGIDLSGITTCASLADALAWTLSRIGVPVSAQAGVRGVGRSGHG